MNPVECRVRWCRAVARRLRGAPLPGAPAAWEQMLGDPAALGEARWARWTGDEAVAEDAAGARSDAAAPGVEVGRAPRRGARPLVQLTPRGSALPIGVDAPQPASRWIGGAPIETPDFGSDGEPESPAHRPARRMIPAPPAWERSSAARSGDRSQPLAAPRGAATPEPHAQAANSEAAIGHPEAAPRAAPIEPLPEPPTRLVQGAAGLGRLLSLVPRIESRRGAAPAPKHPPARQVVPMPRGLDAPPVPTDRDPPPSAAGLPSPGTASAAPADPLDIDAVLDALLDRMRIEYLRHYGSAD